MLLIFLVVVLVAALMLGVSMCRLAALSDRKQAGVLADWSALRFALEQESWSTERSPDELPLDPPGEAFRAAG